VPQPGLFRFHGEMAGACSPGARCTRSVVAAAAVLTAALVAVRGAPAATSTAYLTLAERGVAAAKATWWNPQLDWYDARLPATWNPAKPLARLWDAFPLFEALDAIAIASPTPAHRAAVRAFADGAERYYDPNLVPVGGYTWYPDTKRADEHAYFDDNGWWELAFLDAYRATASARYLVDAERAFRFVAEAGWDKADGGGVWWDTLHLHRTSEPLAAEIYVGFALYDITGDATYRNVAQRFLHWANTNLWNATTHLYGRDRADPTAMDYVQGMMIGALLEQCRLPGRRAHACPRAEQVANASYRAFPHQANWTPVADALYLRFMLDLYRADDDPRWYRLAAQNAARALVNARAPDGLFIRRWDGRWFPGALLQTHAATVSLFAWLGGTPPPNVRSAPVTARDQRRRRVERA
jgi:uncharacterized protein YyaL (SSP411 family)